MREFASTLQVSETTPGGDCRPRKIIHVDMDAFFASVEQRDNPELRGRRCQLRGTSLRGALCDAFGHCCATLPGPRVRATPV